jgi:hypothetical protein
MLQRNLLYTGITRGKRLVVLVGQKKAVAIGPAAVVEAAGVVVACTAPVKADRLVGLSHGGHVRDRAVPAKPQPESQTHHFVIAGTAIKVL